MIDIVLKNLATTIVKTETLKLALSIYIQEPRLQQFATELRSEIQTSQRNLIDRQALDSALDPINNSFSDTSNRMQLLRDNTNSLDTRVTQLQTEVTDICNATDSKQMLLERLDTQTGTLLAAQHHLEQKQLSDKQMYVDHLKDLSERLTRILV